MRVVIPAHLLYYFQQYSDVAIGILLTSKVQRNIYTSLMLNVNVVFFYKYNFIFVSSQMKYSTSIFYSYSDPI